MHIPRIVPGIDLFQVFMIAFGLAIVFAMVDFVF